jgi:hypothetical protein
MITLMADFDLKRLLISHKKLDTQHFQPMMLLSLQRGFAKVVILDH